MDKVIEGTQRLVNGRFVVGRMHLVEVDIVRLQAAQTALNGLHNVLARSALVIGAAAHLAIEFCCQDNLAPAARVTLEPATDILLGSANCL